MHRLAPKAILHAAAIIREMAFFAAATGVGALYTALGVSVAAYKIYVSAYNYEYYYHIFFLRAARIIYRRLGLSSACASGDNSKNICAT